MISQFLVLDEFSAWCRAGFNCATGTLQFNEGLCRREIVVVQFTEAFQLFDPEFIRVEISVTELKQYWEREESGEKS